jgi:hypothetical protein
VIKALLVVTLMSGAEYAVNMPDMDTCMKNANLVEGQGRGAEAICIPQADKSAKVKDMFTMFGDVVERLQENELGTSSGKCRDSFKGM